MTSAFLNDIESALATVKKAFMSADAEFQAYITSKGGLEGAIADMESNVSYAVTTLTALGSIMGVPAADLALLQKVYASIQSIMAVITKVQAVLPAATAASHVVMAGVAAAAVHASIPAAAPVAAPTAPAAN